VSKLNCQLQASLQHSHNSRVSEAASVLHSSASADVAYCTFLLIYMQVSTT